MQLEPNLPQLIQSMYGISIKGYNADSSSIELDTVCGDAVKVHSLIEEKVASLCTVAVSLIPSPLVNAGKKACSTLPVIVTVSRNEIVLISSSEEILEKAKDAFTRKPYVNAVQLSRFNETCLSFSFTDRFTFDYVNVRRDEDKLVLEGFDKVDVQAAKKEVTKFLDENFKKNDEANSEVFLACSEPQLAYLSRLLQSNESDKFLKNLPAVVNLKAGNVCICGSKEEIAETSDSLLSTIPGHSSHTLRVKNSRFLKPLLEQHTLTTVDHIFGPQEKDAKEKCDKVTVFLFNSDLTALTEVGKTLNVSLTFH